MTARKHSHKDHGVAVSDTGFSPDSVEARVGDDVTFTNHTQKEISVVFPAGDGYPTTDSGPVAPGKAWTHTFPDAGSFPFHLGWDDAKKGTVSVS